MDIGECDLFEKLQCLTLVLLGLAGEAHDEVGGKAAAGEIFAQKLGGLIKPCGVVLAVHGLQGCIAAGLQRQVEMPAHAAGIGDAAAEILGDDARLD